MMLLLPAECVRLSRSFYDSQRGGNGTSRGSRARVATELRLIRKSRPDLDTGLETYERHSVIHGSPVRKLPARIRSSTALT
jgi:hypothetical protein